MTNNVCFFLQVTCQGQVIAGILADTQLHAQRAARAVVIEYQELEPIITIKVRSSRWLLLEVWWQLCYGYSGKSMPPGNGVHADYGQQVFDSPGPSLGQNFLKVSLSSLFLVPFKSLGVVFYEQPYLDHYEITVWSDMCHTVKLLSIT